MTLIKGCTDVCPIPAWQQGEAGARVSWCKILGKVPCGSECGHPRMEEAKALAGSVMGRIVEQLKGIEDSIGSSVHSPQGFHEHCHLVTVLENLKL